ncbi:MAG: hypothetical protein ACYS67_13530 [Planctomycetota bacterium]|jgi:hypothetical protein
MNENTANNDTEEPSEQKPKIIAGYLASAIDLEDEVSDSVYRDYMDRAKWPADIDTDEFQEIQKYLTTLIEDTKRHRTIISGLIEKYGRDKAAG